MTEHVTSIHNKIKEQIDQNIYLGASLALFDGSRWQEYYYGQVQPGQPVRAGDAEGGPVRQVDGRLTGSQPPLLAQRITVVPDRARVGARCRCGPACWADPCTRG